MGPCMFVAMAFVCVCHIYSLTVEGWLLVLIVTSHSIFLCCALINLPLIGASYVIILIILCILPACAYIVDCWFL